MVKLLIELGTDFVADDTIFIPEAQEVDCHDEEDNATVTNEDTQISSEHQRSNNDNISEKNSLFIGSN